MTKPRLDSFAEKISPAQKQQLIEWLADHTYSEVCDLIATEPPDGFGLQTSVSTGPNASLKLTRATSSPARTISVSTSMESVDGPKVATILVRECIWRSGMGAHSAMRNPRVAHNQNPVF